MSSANASRLTNDSDSPPKSGGPPSRFREIAYRLKFLPALEYKRTQTAVEEIGRMLNGLITSLQPESEEQLAN
jgi:hypothetical protein